MGVDRRLVEWIKVQLSQGYTTDYIRRYLIDNGYMIKDVDDSIAAALGKGEKNVESGPKKMYAFYFTLVAGFFVLLESVSLAFNYKLPIADFLSFLDVLFKIGFVESLRNQLDYFRIIFGVISGILLMVNSMLMSVRDKAFMGSVFALLLMLVSYITVTGFYLGFILALVSAILGFLGK